MMPFGLINAPVIYQKLINDILQDILNEYIIVYLDDTLIYLSEILEDYIIKIKRNLWIIQQQKTLI